MQSIVQRERQLKQNVLWGIKHFDKVINQEADYWKGTIKMFSFKPIRNEIIPELLSIYVKWGTITQSQQNTLLTQCQSPDREDWYMAFLTIKCLKPYKVKKQ